MAGCQRVLPEYPYRVRGDVCRASAISGISASVASLPLDNAKTKLQKMTKNVDGSLPYKNIFDAMGKVVR